MSRRARIAAACALTALLAAGASAGSAWADDPAVGPSPDPGASGLPIPISPTPTPSVTTVGAATRLTLTVDSAGALAASWRPGAGDTAFTASASGGGRTERVDTAGTTASFRGMPAGSVVTVEVTAHGDGADGAPVGARFTMPPAVAPVTDAVLRADAAGLVLSWRAPRPLAPGSRFLAVLTGADRSSRSRMVAAGPVPFTGLIRGEVYSATVTVITGASRGAAVGAPAVVWTAPPVVAPVAAPVPAATAPAPAPSPTASVTAAAAQPTAQRTLVSSPLAAAALAAAAVLLGGLAIGLLLRRPARA